jgi:hypothetical protein
MDDFTSETTTRTIHRWIVPAAEPQGADAAEIGKAWAVAERAYRDHFGFPDERPLHGDALRFHVRDDEIVIEFATEARHNGAAPLPTGYTDRPVPRDVTDVRAQGDLL